MARGKKVIQKRKTEPDTLYGSRMLTKFINGMMKDGKKGAAQTQVYDALELLKGDNQDPLKLFEQAIHTVAPKMEVRPRRVGGASYQVPTEVRGDRRISLSIRWIIAASHKRSNKEFRTFSQKLAAEVKDIMAGQGEAVRKRDAMHRMAEANRAFAHFRW